MTRPMFQTQPIILCQRRVCERLGMTTAGPCQPCGGPRVVYVCEATATCP
jgi:hypothetical protein